MTTRIYRELRDTWILSRNGYHYPTDSHQQALRLAAVLHERTEGR